MQDKMQEQAQQVQETVEQAQEQVQQTYEQAQQTYEQVQQEIPAAQRPAEQLPTNRSWAKMVFLGLITCGIYPLVINSKISENINTIASRYDGKHTMHYCLLFFLIAPITLGIGALVWQHKISNRIGDELKRRNLGYEFSAKTFWGWGILGSFIIVGPFIYLHKFCKSMNTLAADYNERG